MIHIDCIVYIIMTRFVIFHNEFTCISLLQYTHTQTSTSINTNDLYVYEWADFYPNFIPYDYG